MPPVIARQRSELVSYRFVSLRSAYAIEQIAQEQTVRGQFVRDVLAAGGLPEDQRRRVLITGLRAFDGRPDLEVI